MIEFKKYKKPINGDINLYGEKIISILAVLLASLAKGKSKIANLLESNEILNLIQIMTQFGVLAKKEEDIWIIDSKGYKEFEEPTNIINIGNSVEILYYLIGIFSSFNLKIFFTGDHALNTYNLENIFNIFKNVKFIARQDKYLPFLMIGENRKKDSIFKVNKEDIFLKKTLLFSSINNIFKTTIKENIKTEDHLEVMFKYFDIIYEEHNIGNIGNLSVNVGKELIVNNKQDFSARNMTIPSSNMLSIFIATIAILIPNSNICLKSISMNQYKNSFYKSLVDLGVDIKFVNQRMLCNNKVNDIIIYSSELRDTAISETRVKEMLFEYPLLIFLASLSKATIEIQGINYIKMNDFYNYNYLLNIMKILGVEFKEKENSLIIKGQVKNLNSKIDIDDNLSINVKLTLALYGLFLNNSVYLSKTIEMEFPNIENIFKHYLW